MKNKIYMGSHFFILKIQLRLKQIQQNLTTNVTVFQWSYIRGGLVIKVQITKFEVLRQINGSNSQGDLININLGGLKAGFHGAAMT